MMSFQAHPGARRRAALALSAVDLRSKPTSARLRPRGKAEGSIHEDAAQRDFGSASRCACAPTSARTGCSVVCDLWAVRNQLLGSGKDARARLRRGPENAVIRRSSHAAADRRVLGRSCNHMFAMMVRVDGATHL